MKVAYDILVWKQPEARVLAVIVDDVLDDLLGKVAQLAADRPNTEHMEIYVHERASDVRTRGWAAKVTWRRGEAPQVRMDNDPDLRRLVKQAFQ